MKAIQQSVRSGAILGLVIIFLELIGFTTIAAELIGRLLGGGAEGAAIATRDLLIFLGLLGLWGGFSSVRNKKRPTISQVIINGLATGASAGVLVFVFIFIIGSLHRHGIDMRTYLNALSPENVEFLISGKEPLYGALIQLGTLLAGGFLGGILAFTAKRITLHGASGQGRISIRHSLQKIPWIERALSSKKAVYVIYAGLLMLAILIPLGLDQYWNYNLGTIGIYILMGLGLNIVVGQAGLLDLGYVAFFAVGAYTAGLLTAPPPQGLGLGFWTALPLAIGMAALTGVLLGIPVLRLRGDYLAIVTLGFGEIIRILSKSDLLADFTGGPQGVRNIAGPTLFGRAFTNEREFMYLIVFSIMLIIVISYRLSNSRIGRSWVAIREDEMVAQAMGINTLRYKLLAFGIGAAFAGLGGLLFAARNQYTGPEDHTLMVSINVLCLIIVGGMGSIPGVIVGAVALKGLPEILRQLESYRLITFGALLVIMMILRPEGLLPAKRQQLEVHAKTRDGPSGSVGDSNTQESTL